MYFESDYDRREFIGREALKELQDKYPKLLPFPLFFTVDKFSPYDASFIKTDNHGRILQRYKVEIKVRDSIYDEYVLEPRKLRSIRNNCDYLTDEEVTILYINFTPENCIVWNISNIDDHNRSKLYANKATSSSRKDKINKDVILLNPKDGLRLNYVINPERLIREFDDKEKKRKSIKNKLISKGIVW